MNLNGILATTQRGRGDARKALTGRSIMAAKPTPEGSAGCDLRPKPGKIPAGSSNTDGANESLLSIGKEPAGTPTSLERAARPTGSVAGLGASLLRSEAIIEPGSSKRVIAQAHLYDRRF